MRFINLSGKKFGRLTAIEPCGSRPGGGTIWRLKCDCGNVVECDGANIRYGKTKSCGCLHAEGKKIRHGRSKTTTHNSWVAMRQRCNNPTSKYFVHYGARGIKVCARWEIFDNFLADMGDAPPGMSIDRIDNDGDYEPGNCRWTNQNEQVRNRRISLIYEFNGKSMTIKQWGDEYGIPYKVMHHRFNIGKRGYDLLAPLRITKSRKQAKT